MKRERSPMIERHDYIRCGSFVYSETRMAAVAAKLAGRMI